MACLDTCVILDIRARNSATRARVLGKLGELRRRNEEAVVSRFTWAELYVGVSQAADPAAEEAGIREVLDLFPVLEFNDKAARSFGKTVAHLYRMGRPIGDVDLLIAGTALSAGHSVVTRDVEHFARIPGLTVESY